MIKSVSRRYNRSNLITVCMLLKNFAPFPFFGTLLGLTREGDIIKGDDDIDLFIDARYLGSIVPILVSAGYTIEAGVPPNTTPYFLQATKIIEDVETFVDIYLYENRPDFPWIIERWNFGASPDIEGNHIYIPKDLVFPLKVKTFRGVDLFVPSKSAECCAYLYGPTWKDKISKSNKDYKILVHNHKPTFMHRDDLAYDLVERNYALSAEIFDLRDRLAQASHDRDARMADCHRLAEEQVRLTQTLAETVSARDALEVERERLAEEQSRLTQALAEAVSARDALEVERDRIAQNALCAIQASADVPAVDEDVMPAAGDIVVAPVEDDVIPAVGDDVVVPTVDHIEGPSVPVDDVRDRDDAVSKWHPLRQGS